MRLFGIPEAKYYCAGFTTAVLPTVGSVGELLSGHLAGAHVLREGTPEFNEFRTCLLRGVEACLFQSASLYRRSFDLMTPSAANWAHVTLYYASFFAAHALLGLFGGYLKPGLLRVEVTASGRGVQELSILRSKKGTDWGTYTGTHRRFWDYFYRAMIPIQPLVDAGLAFALTPVLAKPEWLIDARNEVNYNSFTAMDLASSFQRNTRASRLRATLPGTTSTQFRVCEGLLRIAFAFAGGFRLVTDGLDMLRPAGTRSTKVRALAYDVTRPSLSRWIRRRGVVG